MDWRLVTLCVVLAAGLCVSLYWVKGYADDRQEALEEYLGPDAAKRRGPAPAPLKAVRAWPEDTPVLLSWRASDGGIELARLTGKGRLLLRRRSAEGAPLHRWSSLLLSPAELRRAWDRWRGPDRAEALPAPSAPALIVSGYKLPTEPAMRSTPDRLEAWIKPYRARLKSYPPRELLVTVQRAQPRAEGVAEGERRESPLTWPLGLAQPPASGDGPHFLNWSGSSSGALRLYKHVEGEAPTRDKQQRLWAFTRLDLPGSAAVPSEEQR